MFKVCVAKKKILGLHPTKHVLNSLSSPIPGSTFLSESSLTLTLVWKGPMTCFWPIILTIVTTLHKSIIFYFLRSLLLSLFDNVDQAKKAHWARNCRQPPSKNSKEVKIISNWQSAKYRDPLTIYKDWIIPTITRVENIFFSSWVCRWDTSSSPHLENSLGWYHFSSENPFQNNYDPVHFGMQDAFFFISL